MKNITDYRRLSAFELFILGLITGVIVFVIMHEVYDLYKAYDFEWMQNLSL